MPKWFKAARNDSDGVEISIYSEIGGFGVGAKEFAEQLKALGKPSTIQLSISSDGGDVSVGFAIYDMLARHPARKIVRVQGLAASMASVIAMAGDEVVMPSNAQLMIHNPWGSVLGDSEQIISFGEALGQMRENIAQAYMDKTGLSQKEIFAMMDRETWLTAKQAVEMGFADRVEKATAMAAVKVDLSRFANVPETFARTLSAKEESVAWTYPEQIRAICKLYGNVALADAFIAQNVPRAEVLERLVAQKQKAEAINNVLALRAGRETKAEVNKRLKAETTGHVDFASFAEANSKAYIDRRKPKHGME